MNWINIKTTFIRSPEFMGAEPIERATWLCLLAYCCEQENAGRISACEDWKCRRWQQTCGVSFDEVRTSSDLWTWDGDSLEVFGYPKDKEIEVVAKREGGKRGGRPKTKDEKPYGLSELKGELKPHGLGELKGELKRKGKERKGKEEEEEGNKASPPPPPADRGQWTLEQWMDQMIAFNPSRYGRARDSIAAVFSFCSDKALRTAALEDFWVSFACKDHEQAESFPIELLRGYLRAAPKKAQASIQPATRQKAETYAEAMARITAEKARREAEIEAQRAAEAGQ